MLSVTHDFTPAGRIKRPSYSTVATWVKESWDEVDNDLIQRSFKCCGISTKTDGSEDHYIFDYNQLSGSINDNDEIIEVEDNNEIYIEENNYENEWNVGNNNKNEDQELFFADESSTDEEEEKKRLNVLRKKYKGKQCD